jgi:hypothetical protein
MNDPIACDEEFDSTFRFLRVSLNEPLQGLARENEKARLKPGTCFGVMIRPEGP